jgi:hypothetical protein
MTFTCTLLEGNKVAIKFIHDFGEGLCTITYRANTFTKVILKGDGGKELTPEEFIIENHRLGLFKEIIALLPLVEDKKIEIAVVYPDLLFPLFPIANATLLGLKILGLLTFSTFFLQIIDNDTGFSDILCEKLSPKKLNILYASNFPLDEGLLFQTFLKKIKNEMAALEKKIIL